MISSLKKKAVMILLSITVIIAMTPMMAFATGETQVDAGTLKALNDAIAGSATTIKLTDNIEGNIEGNIEVPAGKTVTIDLNGYNITGNGTDGTYDTHPTIRNLGTLTIIGSGVIGNKQSGQSAIFNTGTATLSGGTYTSTGWYVLRNEGTMTINDGVKVSQGNISATPVINGLTRNVANKGTQGTMTINGGDFSGYYNVVKNGDKNGNLTINGGNFTLESNISQQSKT